MPDNAKKKVPKRVRRVRTNPFDKDSFKKGIAYVESSDGKYLWNKNSSATGKYQFLYNEIKDLPEMAGMSREEFVKNFEAQDSIMDLAIEGKLQGRPGLYRNSNDLTREFSGKLGNKWKYRPDEVAAITHFIGRQGARNYFKAVNAGLPYLPPGRNKTVEDYLKSYNRGIAGYKPEPLGPVEYPLGETHSTQYDRGAAHNQFKLGGETDPPVKKRDNTSVKGPHIKSPKRPLTTIEEEMDRLALLKAKEHEGVMYETQPQSSLSKVWDVLGNPFTAAELMTKQGYIPDNFKKAIDAGVISRNPLELAGDVINPVDAINVVKEVPSLVKKGDYGQAILQGASALPLLGELNAINKKMPKYLDDIAKGEIKKQMDVNHHFAHRLRKYEDIKYNGPSERIKEILINSNPLINKRLKKINNDRFKKVNDRYNEITDKSEKYRRHLKYLETGNTRFDEKIKYKLLSGDLKTNEIKIIRENPSFMAFAERRGLINDDFKNLDNLLDNEELVDEFLETWSKSRRGITLNNANLDKKEDALRIGGRGQWSNSFGDGNYSSNSNTVLRNFSTVYDKDMSGYIADIKIALPGMDKAKTAREKLKIINKYTAHDLNSNFNKKLRDPDMLILEAEYGRAGSAERVVKQDAILKDDNLLKTSNIRKRTGDIDKDIHNKMGKYGLRNSQGNPDLFPYSREPLKKLESIVSDKYQAELSKLSISKRMRINRKREEIRNEVIDLRDKLMKIRRQSLGIQEYNRQAERIHEQINSKIKYAKQDLKVLGISAGLLTGVFTGAAKFVNYLADSAEERYLEDFESLFENKEDALKYEEEFYKLKRERLKGTNPNNHINELNVSEQIRKELDDKYNIGKDKGRAYRYTNTNFALGGQLNNNTMNNENLLTEFNAGGSHEQNPLGGIPQGIGANGKPNMVEQGETKKGNYVYSDRLEIDDVALNKYKLPRKLKGKTFAEASKVLNKQLKENSQGKIDRESTNEMLDRLKVANEETRLANEPNDFKYGGNMYNEGGEVTTADMTKSGPGLGELLGGAETLLDFGTTAFGKTGVNDSGIVDPDTTDNGPSGGMMMGSNALKGASQGFAIGGPWGAAIGGALGLGAGFFGAKKKKEALEEASHNFDVRKANAQNFKDGGYLHPNDGYLNNSYFNGGPFQLASIQSGMKEAEKQLNTINNLNPSTATTVSKPNYTPSTGNEWMSYGKESIPEETAELSEWAKDSDFLNLNKDVDRGFQSQVDRGMSTIEPLNTDQGSEKGKFNPLELLRYAPAVTNAAQLLSMKKPNYETLDKLDARYKPSYVDEQTMLNNLKRSGNVDEAIANTAGGSRGALRSNLLAAHLNKLRGTSDAYLKASEINRGEDSKAQQFNVGVDKVNVQQSNLEKDINARNRAAFDTNKSTMLSALGNDLGNIGLEELRKKYPGLAGYDYDHLGRYIAAMEAEKAKNKANRTAKKATRKANKNG